MSNLDSASDDRSVSSPSGAELAAAERAVNAVLGGMKNYAIFPPEHASTQMLIQGVLQAISRYTERYGDLSFEVERQRVLFREHPVFEGEATDDNPAFVLYRDGVRWFEFLQGLQEEELVDLFRIFNHYRVIPEEPEDDLVTALWRADLAHILYEASFEFWDNEPETDPGVFQPADPDPAHAHETVAAEGKGWEKIRPDSGNDDYDKMSLGLAEGGQALWSLTPEEQVELDRMIGEEQEHDSSEAAIRLMFLVLRQENEPQIYESIISYLREEFRSALSARNFRRGYFILDNVRKMEEIRSGEYPWISEIHERFHAGVVKPEVLEALVSVWPILSTMDAADIKTFVAVLQLLPTKAGVTLAGMLDRIGSKHAKSLITEIIASYATRDIAVLETLLGRNDEDLVLRLIRVVRDMEDGEAVARVLEKVKNHPRSKIRQEAQRLMGRTAFYR